MFATSLGVLGLFLTLGACAETTAAVPVNGTTTLSSAFAAGDPCRGKAFDADHADPRCMHHGIGSNTPPPSAVRISMAPNATARSGYDAEIYVDITNVTSEPLLLDMDDACGTFEGQASNVSATSFESDCFGLCAGSSEPHVLRVTLEPGGTIKKKVKFFAVQTRVMMDEHEECVQKTMGGLPPGVYDLRVTLPWTDAVPEDTAVTRPRVIESKLTVTL